MEANQRKLQWALFGVYFGYPDCCIEYFCTRKTKKLRVIQQVVITGRGFVPCPKCANRIIDYSVEHNMTLTTEAARIKATQSIITNRYCPDPFPEKD